ncbi:MAG: HEAT repeat domain-containing protein [Sandaracinaceae bacterium]
MTPDKLLARIFEADRQVRDAEDELMRVSEERLSALFAEAVEDALDNADEEESTLRLSRLADLCAQVPGPRMADTLIAILGHEDPAVRVEAGEAIRDVAYERFKEIAQAVERALDRDQRGIAMQELPFVLTEVRDPDPIPLVARFLAHPEPEVVAAAIEAIAAYGDPTAAEHLMPLVDDEREASLEDLEAGPTPIGELARNALEELGIEE